MNEEQRATKVARLHLRCGFFETESGEPVYLVGANFWPKRSGPWMYRDEWNREAIGHDLGELAALGANAVRIFCFWPDFAPTEEAISEDALQRLETLVALGAQRGMWSLPTLFVGHMSGENWDPPWRRGRDWYTDGALLERQEYFIAEVVGRFRGDPRVAAWIVSNEWPAYAGATDDATGISWAARMCAAVRKADPGRPVSLGDGAWDVLYGQHNGLPALALRDVVDFFGPHFYPKETDALRHSLTGAFAVAMLEPLGKPILVEEFGCSSDQADDEYAADYYRTTLWTSFASGDCGALAWNSHDFTLAHRRPYSHHPFELHFGLIRTDGTVKPQAHELARFARVTRTFDLTEWEPADPHAAIARTAYFLQSFPFDWGWSKADLRDLYLQTFALCAKGKLDAGFVDLCPLPDGVESRPVALPKAFKLLLVPCMQQVTTQNAAQLEACAQAGGAVYISYGGEPWHGDLATFIGAQPRIRYGLVEPAQADTVALTFVQRFGGIEAGQTLRVAVCGQRRRGAHLVCRPATASVLAVDEAGAPALLRRRAGAGVVLFSTYPLEYYAMSDQECDDDLWRLYGALAAEFDCKPGVYADHPLVQTFSFRSRTREDRMRIVAVNHAWEDVEFFFQPTSLEGTDLESGVAVDGSHSVALPKKDVRIFEVNIRE